MSVVRRFLVAPSLVRLLRKERGGARITEGYFAPQAGRTSFVRLQGNNCFLVLVTGAEGATSEERTEVPRAHGDALLDVCAGKAIYERTAVALAGTEALVDRYVRPAGLDLVSLVFEEAEAAKTFVPPVWFGAEVSTDAAYDGQAIALTGVPSAGEVPLSNAALDAVLDLIEPRFGSARPVVPPPPRPAAPPAAPPAPAAKAPEPPRPAAAAPAATNPAQPAAPPKSAEAAKPAEPAKPADATPKPAEAPRPAAPPAAEKAAAPTPAPKPAEPPKPAAPPKATEPAKPAPAPKPAEPPKAAEPARTEAPKAAEPKASEPPKPAEPAKPAEAPKAPEPAPVAPPAAAASVAAPDADERLPPDARIDDVIESLSKALGAAIRNPQEPGRDDEVAEAFERWQVRPRRTQQT